MKKCFWVRPKLVAQIEFLEWTESDHLRHSKFVGLREDKDASPVRKEEKGNRENSGLQMVGALVSHPARYFNWNVLTFSRNNRF